MRAPKGRAPHRKMRRLLPSVCRRSASFIFFFILAFTLGFGETGVANKETEAPPLSFHVLPGLRASRGRVLQRSGEEARRENDACCPVRRGPKHCTSRRVMIFMRPQQGEETRPVKTVEVGVIGVGWIGGLRADTLSRTALVDRLHLCDIKPDRLAEVTKLYKPATSTLDYQDIIKNEKISVVYVSTTPEANHYPIARDCLKSGKNVMLEKPIALELWEADELIQLASRNNLKFTIGYSQRFNPKIAYAKKKIVDGTLGKVVSVLVSRHLSRELGKKIASRVRLSPVVMELTHDLDFVFWLLEPAKPVRVYSQGAYGYMQPVNGSHDIMFTTVTMDNGVVVMIGGGWNFPPSFPNYCSTWIEITGTDGALTLDDTQRDNWLNTEKRGQEFPMSTMPGEWVDHVFAGGIGPETIHFLEACIRDTAVMVTPESARRVMETYSAADLSADRNTPSICRSPTRPFPASPSSRPRTARD